MRTHAYPEEAKELGFYDPLVKKPKPNFI